MLVFFPGMFSPDWPLEYVHCVGRQHVDPSGVTLLHACEHTGETESSNLPFKAPYSAKAIHRQWLKQSPGQVLHIVRIQVAR